MKTPIIFIFFVFVGAFTCGYMVFELLTLKGYTNYAYVCCHARNKPTDFTNTIDIDAITLESYPYKYLILTNKR